MSACLALIERPSSPKKRHLSLVPPRSSEIPAAWIVFAYNFNQEGQRILRRQIGAIGGAGTQNTAYTYDARLSLASSTRTGAGSVGTTNYAFDSNINRTRDGSSTFAYEFNNLIDSGGGQSFNHNAVGQITAQVSNGGSLNYQYNWNDQIKRVTGSVGVNYVYDGSGNRVSKQFDNNGAKTDYLWNGSEVLKEYNGDGSVKAQYLMGLGREGIKTGGKWSFYLNDALDSTYMLVDASGHVNGQWSYDDWGNSTTLSAPARTSYNPYLFQGQQFDAETGLYSMRARYYDPKTARFTSPDPIRLGGGRNMYTAFGGDPIGRMDPSGLQEGPDPGARQLPFPLSKAGNPNLIKRYKALPPDTVQDVLDDTAFVLSALEIGMMALETGSIMLPARAQRPSRAYNRRADYGRTPTPADRRAIGVGPGQVADHNPPLVKRFYEGDPSIGEKPGYQMTSAERRASAADRNRMLPQPRAASDAQGAEMSRYSKEMKKFFGL